MSLLVELLATSDFLFVIFFFYITASASRRMRLTKNMFFVNPVNKSHISWNLIAKFWFGLTKNTILLDSVKKFVGFLDRILYF